MLVKDIEDLPERDMTRFEFYESLVRIASGKYKDTGIEKNYIDSFNRLLNEHIIPISDLSNWQQWRETKLWTLEVNDILEANLTNILKLYRSYFKPKQNYLALPEAIQMSYRDTNLL